MGEKPVFCLKTFRKFETEEKPQEMANTGSDESAGMWLTFRCCLTVEQAVLLKEFFVTNGIKFERA